MLRCIVNSMIPYGIFRHSCCYFSFLPSFLLYLPSSAAPKDPTFSHFPVRSFVSCPSPLPFFHLLKELPFFHFLDQITVPYYYLPPNLGNGCILLSWFLQLLLRHFSVHTVLPVSWHFILSRLLVVVIGLDCKMCL